MLKKNLKFIRSVILYLLKTIVGVFLKLTVLTIFSIGIFLWIISSYNKNKEIKIKKDSFISVTFPKPLKEVNDTFSFEDKNLTLYETIRGIKKASRDSRIKGIYLDLDQVSLTPAQIEEVGKALTFFRKNGKKIYSFGRSLNNRNYSLALYSDKIVIPPSASTDISLGGYYHTFTYFKGLADFVGINFKTVHVGDYKAYGEQYSKSHMSPAFKEDITRLYNTFYDLRVDEISKVRNLNREKLERSLLNGDLVYGSYKDVKKKGLIDETLYKDQFFSKYKINNMISLAKFVASNDILPKENRSKIAIIYAIGELTTNEANNLANKVTITGMKKKIQKAINNDNIKGIVLRVNSPGGEAIVGEVVHHLLSNVHKKIYVSMGDYAASGGYYISAGADKIFADKRTITGSIGVVSLIPNIEKLSKNLKLNIETVKKGHFSDLNSPYVQPTKASLKKIYDTSFDIYKEFKSRVTKGRHISDEKLETIAGGRVWLGTEGVKNNLVDEIGSLDETIIALAKDLNLKNYSVVEMEDKASLLSNLSNLGSKYLKADSLILNFIKSPVKTAIKTTTEFEVNKPLLLLPIKLEK